MKREPTPLRSFLMALVCGFALWSFFLAVGLSWTIAYVMGIVGTLIVFLALIVVSTWIWPPIEVASFKQTHFARLLKGAVAITAALIATAVGKLVFGNTG
jgi:hypothetical protein